MGPEELRQSYGGEPTQTAVDCFFCSYNGHMAVSGTSYDPDREAHRDAATCPECEKENFVD